MNIRQQIKRDIETVISSPAVARALAGKQLTVDSRQIEVTRTSDPKFGDYSTNVALRLTFDKLRVAQGKPFKQSPMEIARILADNIVNQPYVEKAEVAEPGFVNIFVKSEIWQNEVINVLKKGEKFGSNDQGKGKKARVEFVSANPTGPLHFGNARGGPIGDTLAAVLEFSGYKVLREYIHNDIGEQVRKLGETIANVAKGEKLEDQEYKGQYIKEIVEKIGNFKTPEEAGKLAVDMMLDEALADCEAMGIKFDKVYPESGFVESGDTKRAIEELEKKGVLKKKEGAMWFAPYDEFLEDRETVVVKSDGNYTYFSNDIAYHKIKFSEGYDLVIDVFGANHHGHVPRLQAVIKAFGFDVSKFHVILYQWVRFKKGGQLVAMSKRSGNFVTAKEVLDMVGPDAVRFFILMHDPNSHIDFDLDLAKEKSNKNPVFYVQYAHARIASIMAKAGSGISAARGPVTTFPSTSARSGKLDTNADFESNELRASGSLSSRATTRDGTATRFDLLSTGYELNLIKKITKFPELVEDIARNFGAHALTTYAVELADGFHKFYENCRVLNAGDEQLTRARLALLDATRIALSNTLRLLGVSAPSKM